MSGPDLCKHGNPIPDVDWPNAEPCPECARETDAFLTDAVRECERQSQETRRKMNAMFAERSKTDSGADETPPRAV